MAKEMARSSVWHGNLSPATPPTVRGEVRANALVTPVAGTWTGGWEGDGNALQLAACRSRDGSGCITLGACPNGSTLVDPAFTGHYLRVADEAVEPDRIHADLLIGGSPYRAGAWAAGPTVSAAIVG